MPSESPLHNSRRFIYSALKEIKQIGVWIRQNNPPFISNKTPNLIILQFKELFFKKNQGMISKYSPIKGTFILWRNGAGAGKIQNYPGTSCSTKK